VGLPHGKPTIAKLSVIYCSLMQQKILIRDYSYGFGRLRDAETDTDAEAGTDAAGGSGGLRYTEADTDADGGGGLRYTEAGTDADGGGIGPLHAVAGCTIL
jgi:hypothetical protein